MALTCYNKEIRKAKRSSLTDYCQGIEDIPDRARLMRIIASQSASRVESIKLLDSRNKQSGKETLRELYRVHFSWVCWRRSNLGRIGAAKPESICCSQGGLGTI
jgi:hypothetical protein